MHIMVDLETLGQKPWAVILSAGLVAFDENGVSPDALHIGIDPQDQMKRLGRRADWDTVAWWLKQSHEARRRVVDIPKLEPGVFVEMISSFVGRQYDRKSCVWAKGPSFDLTLLNTLFSSLGQELPWPFWQERDVRTAEMVVGKTAVKGVAHDALDDAKHQAGQVIKFLNHIKQ